MINKALLRLHLILSSCCKYSNNLNNKRNNASFSVQNITTKAILATAVNMSLLFTTITETPSTQGMPNRDIATEIGSTNARSTNICA